VAIPGGFESVFGDDYDTSDSSESTSAGTWLAFGVVVVVVVGLIVANWDGAPPKNEAPAAPVAATDPPNPPKPPPLAQESHPPASPEAPLVPDTPASHDPLPETDERPATPGTADLAATDESLPSAPSFGPEPLPEPTPDSVRSFPEAPVPDSSAEAGSSYENSGIKATDIRGVKEGSPEHAAVSLILKILQGDSQGLDQLIADDVSGLLWDLRTSPNASVMKTAKETIGQVKPVSTRRVERDTVVYFRNENQKILQFYVRRIQGEYRVRELRIREAGRGFGNGR
jgi:hypothetical protein